MAKQIIKGLGPTILQSTAPGDATFEFVKNTTYCVYYEDGT